jgi:hypothetical protein
MEKKLRWRSTFGIVEIEEQIFLRNGRVWRPFSQATGVQNRGYSFPLQRVIVDFGADQAFSRVPNKLKEHYGITVPVSAARKITLRHGKALEVSPQTEWPEREGVATLVGESDGCLIPRVEILPPQEGEPADGRRRRKIGWNELRLSLAREKGTVQPIFAGTLGSVEEAGDGLLSCAIRAGMGQKTHVHCVGDGAPWIALQVERVFGTQGSFLVDFYHLCKYLVAAAPSCAPQDSDAWYKLQKKRLKDHQLDDVLESLQPYLEPESAADDKAPVREAWRYIQNRPGQFRYREALKAELPIGSGEVESAHRYVPQQRLKLPGAWWKLDNAQSILNLRINRANDDWDDYWGAERKRRLANDGIRGDVPLGHLTKEGDCPTLARNAA